jgi:lysophospholipase L1-like esterase
MAQLAKANHIKVVLCSVLPAADFPWHPGLHPIEKIIILNNMIKDYATKNGLPYTDYYDAMIDDKKGLRKEWAIDGIVHPNLAGYKIMEPLVQEQIKKALKEKQ